MRKSPRKQKSKASRSNKKREETPQKSKGSSKRKQDSQHISKDLNKKKKTSKQGSNIGTRHDITTKPIETTKVK